MIPSAELKQYGVTFCEFSIGFVHETIHNAIFTLIEIKAG